MLALLNRRIVNSFCTRLMFAGIAVALSLQFAGAASAAPSDLDATYGTNGLVSMPNIATSSEAISTAVQSDGKLVFCYQSSGGGPVVARLNANGTPDTSFGTGGVATLSLAGGSSARANNIVISSSTGKIYVAGSAFVTTKDHLVVWALTSAGQPDLSFYTTSFHQFGSIGVADNQGRGIAIQPDGNLAVASTLTVGTLSGVVLWRVDQAGNIVTAVPLTVGGQDLTPTSLAVEPDGSIVVGGSEAADTTSALFAVLIKFTAAGSPDTTFGPSGVGLVGYPLPMYSYVASVRTDATGSILGAGTSGFISQFVRLNPNGTPLAAFPVGGGARWLPGGAQYSRFSDGAFVAGGKLLLTGDSFTQDLKTSFNVARFNADGTPDTSFAPAGFTSAALSVDTSQLAVQPDGRYLATYTVGKDIYVRRMIGDGPEPAPPVVPLTIALSASLKSSTKASKFKSIAGTAAGTGLSKVELAIQRVDSKLLKKSKKCTYVKSPSGSTTNVKASHGKCVPSKWLKAKGTASWSYKLSKALPAGKYVISVRSVGSGGATSAVKTKSVKLVK